jgi:ArsR family transcriptional regulator, nickel/cobalt-responsive transcriptional repressor
MGALATPSRVRMLGHLRQGPATVGEIVEAVQMAQPAVSHQLRILRDLGLVVGTRQGRHTVYALFDPHVAMLLDEALRHIEHLQKTAINQGEHEMTTSHHSHDGVHEHQHDHGDQGHSHAHDAHQHDHVEHEHEHAHDGETHAHSHAHAAGLEQQHEHAHA